jgi:hypothetical protein
VHMAERDRRGFKAEINLSAHEIGGSLSQGTTP